MIVFNFSRLQHLDNQGVSAVEIKPSSKIRRFSEYAVLVVDDQQSFQSMLKNMLADLGFFNVTTLSSAEECKRACNTNTYNIYLFDYNLGHGENGRQLLMNLHKNKKIAADAIVFIITGDATRPMVLSAIEQEPDDYIIKPISQSILQKRLFKVIDQKKVLKPIYEARYKQQYEEVITLGQEELKASTPYDHTVRIMVAEAMISLNKLDEAEALITEGLAFDNTLDYKLIMAKIKSLQENFDDADESLKEIIRKSPYNITAYKMRYDNYIRQERYDDAEKVIDQAIDISPQSTSLLHMQLGLDAIKKNYLRMRDCIGSLLDLHKFEIKKLTDLLSSYAQVAILFAIDSADPYHIGMLRKTVSSAIRKYQPFLNNASKIGFDLNLFSEIVDARIDIATSNSGKGKRYIFKAINNLKDEINDLPESIFCNVVGSLNQLGEYEFAKSFQDSRPKNEDTETDQVLTLCIDTCRNDPKIAEKKRKYEEINKEGIISYKNGDYNRAIQCFDDALRRAPGNTNVTINKAQSLLKLSQIPNTNKDLKNKYLSDCKYTLAGLDGVPLTEEQTARVNELLEQTNLEPRKK